LASPASELFGNQRFDATRTETNNYEQIRIVFDRGHHRRGVYRFLPTTGNHHRDGTGNDETVTDAIADAAQGYWHPEKSAEDRGGDRSALAVTCGVACADAVTTDCRELRATLGKVCDELAARLVKPADCVLLPW
jgi:hypothetical protein